MQPANIIKDLNDKVAIYPIEEKDRIDRLLLLDKVCVCSTACTIINDTISNNFSGRAAAAKNCAYFAGK